MTPQEQIRQLREQLKEAQSQIASQKLSDNITVKLGEKGNLVFYGLQKVPVSLYLNQMQKLKRVFNSEEFGNFVAENESKFATK